MKQYLMKDSKFNAEAPIKVDSVRIEWMEDESPDLSWLNQDYNEPEIDPEDRLNYKSQDLKRLADYEAGKWSMMGCRAIAEVSRPIGQGSRRLETFTSGGLWGIESDAGEDYRKEVEAGQIEDLRAHLAAFGINLPETMEQA